MNSVYLQDPATSLSSWVTIQNLIAGFHTMLAYVWEVHPYSSLSTTAVTKFQGRVVDPVLGGII